MAVALGIAAAALREAGGEYGDDGDQEWKPRRVLAEYERERDRAFAEWRSMTPAARRALEKRRDT